MTAVDAHLHLDLGGFDLSMPLSAQPGETVALVGPNGAGKSTVLRCLAGLVALQDGHVKVSGQMVDEPASKTWVHPEDRPVSLVFQDHRLFPHLHALDNVAFALRSRGFNRRDARAQAQQHLDAVHLDPQLNRRRPAELSGGQAQRVALARALATGADVLLLDEPLAAVDAQAQTDLRRVIDGLESTVILVTHDPVTARLLADTMVVVEAGRAHQRGPVDQVAQSPATEWAAEMLGQNMIEGHANGTTVVTASGLELTTATPINGDVVVNFAPSGVTLSSGRPDGSARNVWETTVTALRMEADRTVVELDGPLPCRASVTPASVERLQLAPGQSVTASVKATDLRVQPR